MQEAFNSELIGFAHDCGLANVVAAKLDNTVLIGLICRSDTGVVNGFSFNIDGTRFEAFLNVYRSIESSTKCKEVDGVDYSVLRHTYYFQAGISFNGRATIDVMGKTYETIIETYIPHNGNKPHHTTFVDMKESDKFDKRWTTKLEDYTVIDILKIGCVNYVLKTIMTEKLERMTAV